MKLKRTFITIFLISILLSACTPAGTSTPTATVTHTPQPTLSHTPKPTATYTVTPTQTATPEPMILGEIFAPEYNQEPSGIVASQNMNLANSHDSHFDIGIPGDMNIFEDPIISPISGHVTELLFQTSEGTCETGGCAISICADQPVQNEEIIQASQICVNLGHLNSLNYKIGDYIKQGEPIGYAQDLSNLSIGWANKIAFVIMRNGPGHYSPCLINPNLSYCGICYPGALQRNNIDNPESVCP